MVTAIWIKKILAFEVNHLVSGKSWPTNNDSDVRIASLGHSSKM